MILPFRYLCKAITYKLLQIFKSYQRNFEFQNDSFTCCTLPHFFTAERILRGPYTEAQVFQGSLKTRLNLLLSISQDSRIWSQKSFSLLLFLQLKYIYKIVNVLRSIILLVLLSPTNEISCVSSPLLLLIHMNCFMQLQTILFSFPNEYTQLNPL